MGSSGAFCHTSCVKHDRSIINVLFGGAMGGAITFTASVFAYGKLAAKKWAKTISGTWVKPV
ncbi:hypothetical protein, partial [Staphylococcus aureus]|uniref:hypothetical protein n=1 Tax=Staphylococcus aureus TaxID=1280 RepID=UPI001C838EFA